MDLVKPISMEVLEALGPTHDVCQVAAKQGETIELSRARLVAKVLSC